MREIFLHENVKAFIGDRSGGVSSGAYKSLNLGLHVGDNVSNVEQNREIFASFFDAKSENLCFMEQTHGSDVKIVENVCLSHSDAIITQRRNIILCVMVADCVPILLFDPTTKTTAAIHAGRNGAFLGITTNALNLMRENFGAKMKETKAFLGASIRSCCYEIQDKILEEAKKYFAFALQERDKKWFLDIQKIIKQQLRNSGVENILDDNVCTCCNENYFSYRREKTCGRFAAGIQIT